MGSNSLDVLMIFGKAIGIPDGAERSAYIAAACAGKPVVRQEVESLLQSHENCGSFMIVPVSGPIPRATSSTPLIGEPRFGDYELIQEIARGGMGVVYKARQLSLKRTIAIKMILAGQLATEAEVKRFRSEAQAAASLNHPNILAIHEVGECRGQHYYTMPLVEGQSLSEWVELGRCSPGDGTAAARLLAKVARAVHYAHQAGVLHRDLKPDNILIDAQGEPYVMDFGLAKRVKDAGNPTLSGHIFGTPGFMAPEQAREKSGQSGPATDIYSLGAVLYYLLTGRAPFVADSLLDGLMLVLEGEAVLPRRINPQIPGPLEHICMRCLEKKPENRYASAEDLALDLERFAKGDSVSANPKAIGRRVEGWARRQPALVSRLATVLLCLVINEGAYYATHYTTLTRHYAVVGVLILWLVVSCICQRALKNDWHTNAVRLLWSSTDPVALTAILLIAQAYAGPLVILYPALVAASGFWFRVSAVFVTTAVSLLGYATWLVAGGGRVPGVPFHWHILAIVSLIVTGICVSYLTNRVNALSQFYECRPPDPK